MITETEFVAALRANILKTIRRLKDGGTVAMGIDNLCQVCPTPSHNLKGAPNGTNAPYYYRQTFREVCNDNKAIARFLIS